MKAMILLGIGLIAVFLTAGCSSEKGTAPDSYHKITAEEAKTMMDEEDVIIVDVRTLDEYNQGHIPGAISVVNEEIGQELPEALPDQSATLLIYCRSGRRSKEASDKLAALGYTNIYDFGGIIDWPYETIQGE